MHWLWDSMYSHSRHCYQSQFPTVVGSQSRIRRATGIVVHSKCLQITSIQLDGIIGCHHSYMYMLHVAILRMNRVYTHSFNAVLRKIKVPACMCVAPNLAPVYTSWLNVDLHWLCFKPLLDDNRSSVVQKPTRAISFHCPQFWVQVLHIVYTWIPQCVTRIDRFWMSFLWFQLVAVDQQYYKY